MTCAIAWAVAVVCLSASGAYATETNGGPDGAAGGVGDDTSVSDGGVIKDGINYPSGDGQPAISCSVHASGAGMGSSCVTLGASGVVKTLRERFGGQSYQRCRYRELPAGYPPPPDRLGAGRYMFMICLENIDLDTYSGGPDRSLAMFPVWVQEGNDTSDWHNQITDFLWEQFEASNQLPVPVLRAEPNDLPIVNNKTYFTFRWMDPATQEVIADPEGPYAGRADGGPWLQIHTANGFTMRAEATRLKLDPKQSDMEPKVCPDVSTPYVEGAETQPEGACWYVFERSSATADQYNEEPLPADLHRSFWMLVEVEWRITYGRGVPDTELANGFTMRVHQAVPVQEIQAPNEPPMVMFP